MRCPLISILSRDALRLLARMSICAGSAPHFLDVYERNLFESLLQLGLIDGGPGWYGVKWGLLSDFQDSAVSYWRSEWRRVCQDERVFKEL